MTDTVAPTTIHPAVFRRALSNYPTGVAVVTASDDMGAPVAMTVGTFASVSLEPLLVSFMPSCDSRSWERLKATGTRFAVNVLSQDQETLGRDVARRPTDKLTGYDWDFSDSGLPRIAGSVVYLECETRDIHSAGDHDIVIGAVEHLENSEDSLPLLFYRGGYGSFTPRSSSVRSGLSSEILGALDRARPTMEALAQLLNAEVTAMCVSEGHLLFAASAGRPEAVGHSTSIGRSVPFMPPLGSVFAAYGEVELKDAWFSAAKDFSTDDDRRLFESGLERIRRDGYGFAVGHSMIQQMSGRAGEWFLDDAAPVNLRELRVAIHQAAESFNQADFAAEQTYEVHSLTAPVFWPNDKIAFSLTIWFPDGVLTGAAATESAEDLKRAAEDCTAALRRTAA